MAANWKHWVYLLGLLLGPQFANAVTPMAAAGWGCHSLAVDETGVLRIWGCTDFFNGIVASATGTFRSFPTTVPGMTNVTAVAAGWGHSVALKQDGSVWTWGWNRNGQLGNGSFSSAFRTTPSPVAGISNVVAIAAGLTHTVALHQDGSVWFWGQLAMGRGGAPLITKPTQVAGLTGVSAVATKTDHVLALKDDGTVWAWGSNASGELGDGSTTTFRTTPAAVPGLASISGVAAGDGYSFAIGSDGTVWAWGYNSFGMLGDGTRVTRRTPLLIRALNGIDTIAPGNEHVAALRKDGAVLAWGTNFSGNLGDGTSTDRLTPAEVPLMTGVSQISSGSDYSIATKADGTVWSWGNNTGKLGDGTFALRRSPTPVLNEAGNGLLDLKPGTAKQINPEQLPVFYSASVATISSMSTTLTDTRVSGGLAGSVYYTALLPANSTLITANTFASGNGYAASGAVVPVALGRGGAKQTGPSTVAEPVATGTISTGNQFAVYSGATADPLLNSNALICMGVTVPALSAKGQVLMRTIATGDKTLGVTQCPTVQTDATTKLYTGQISGTTTSRTIVASIQAQPEDYGQQRNIYSWAVAPDGTQFMQTGPNAWALMAEPMLPAMTVTVPADGRPITLPVVQGLNLSSLVDTLVYVGLGSSWAEVKQLNKAGHYYTVQ